MNVMITGAGGFLGKRLTRALLEKEEIPGLQGNKKIRSLLLVDAVDFDVENPAAGVTKKIMDIAHKPSLEKELNPPPDVVFHLAAVVSSQAEENFALGLQVNLLATLGLLEFFRKSGRSPKFIMTSSSAVFGGDLPLTLEDTQRVTPQTSYGMEKGVCELLLDDYSRRGFVDGMSLRLPTVVVRSGKPNKAASSFVSSIIREPVKGEEALCPVPKETKVWLTSPQKVVESLLHSLVIPGESLTYTRALCLPGLSVSVQEMIHALTLKKGRDILRFIQFKEDKKISDIVSGWPVNINTNLAVNLGFRKDESFYEILSQYLQKEM